ncbi:uncharacterized protein LOC113280552 [Papaver somniferum]|uniref:uncharacterized protein LOC113280552 n=1 Tax=Papaver somniferum TaxID=3469 RepID=UPI000E6F46D6|nr:uncharacterized protein LOC113280552 [Papaver somniferum]
MKCKDKFLIQSVQVFNNKSGNQVSEFKLRASFIVPATLPPAFQRSENGGQGSSFFKRISLWRGGAARNAVYSNSIQSNQRWWQLTYNSCKINVNVLVELSRFRESLDNLGT